MCTWTCRWGRTRAQDKVLNPRLWQLGLEHTGEGQSSRCSTAFTLLIHSEFTSIFTHFYTCCQLTPSMNPASKYLISTTCQAIAIIVDQSWCLFMISVLNFVLVYYVHNSHLYRPFGIYIYIFLESSLGPHSSSPLRRWFNQLPRLLWGAQEDLALSSADRSKSVHISPCHVPQGDLEPLSPPCFCP